VAEETNSTIKGKMTYYLGLFYELNNAPELAQKFYLDVQTLTAPLFFEYRLNDWALANYSKGVSLRQ
jgi:hypothetical protein